MKDNARVFKGTPAQRAILNANNRYVTHEGTTYLIHAVQVGRNFLADAEPMKKIEGVPPLINLFSESKLARELRGLVEAHLTR